MTDNIMKKAFLRALEQRVRTRVDGSNLQHGSKTMLPIGVVDTDEIAQVLLALDRLPPDAQQQE